MAKLNILIVEDEPMVALSMKKKLEAMGFHVISIVSSGDEAYQITLEKAPDLVLMDIRLEGQLNGLETSEILWKNFQIPSILVTGANTTLLKSYTQEDWCYGVVTKPFGIWELETVMAQALHRFFYEKYSNKENIKEYAQIYNPIREWIRKNPKCPESILLKNETNGKLNNRLLPLEVFPLFSCREHDNPKKLVNSKDYLNHIAFLLWNQFNTNNHKMIQLNLEFEPLFLSEKIIIPVGVILTESFTNSLLFAFPSDPKKRNILDIKFGSTKSKDKLYFKIQDNGKGFRQSSPSSFPESQENGHHPVAQGLGLPIIKGMADLLGSEFYMTGDNGTYIEITFPNHELI